MTAGVRRPALLFALPAVLLLVATVAPLISGARTLYLRDVLDTHLELRSALGRAIRAGEVPLVDGERAGGQGLLGNPNAVPLYPDNLLLLVASDLWQLNAHFWLHWLLALPAMYALARVWGLGREASWAAGVVFAFSGYFVSQMNLYNAVAVVALAPALAAALLAAAEPARRRWAIPALGGGWALALLGGDPILAGLALATAVALAIAERRRLPWGAITLALAAGSLVAAPQWIESLRLLPGSYRGAWGNAPGAQGRASPSPAALIELLVPFYFGRADLGDAWANRYFGGSPPLYFSLAPGLLVLAAIAAAVGERERRVRWATGLLLTSGVLAYSGGVAGPWIARLPGGELFRFHIKFVLPAAIAGTLLAARGLERAFRDDAARRRLARCLMTLLAVEVALALFFLRTGNPLEAGFRALFGRGLDDGEFATLRVGWASMCSFQVLVATLALALVLGARRRPWTAAALLVFGHAATQLVVERGLVPTDDASRYRGSTAMLDALPADAVVAHGAVADLFGDGYFEGGEYPDRRGYWRTRRAYDELFSHTLAAAGRRSEFYVSPEGFDAFPVAATAMAMKRLSDADRVRILRATGVDALLVPRRLDAAVGAAADLISVGDGRPPIFLYRLHGALPDAMLAGDVTYAPHMNAALATVTSASFDATRQTVLSGEAPPRSAPAGVARVERREPTEIVVSVDSSAGGALVVRRAWLAIWRAEIDGAPAAVRIANLTRLAVEVPAGPHRVRFFVSRLPLDAAIAGSLSGVVLLVFLASRRTVYQEPAQDRPAP